MNKDNEYKFSIDFLKKFNFDVGDTILFVAIDEDIIEIVNQGSISKFS